MSGFYFGLPYVERIPKKRGGYHYYFRRNRKVARIPLPDPVSGESLCRQSHNQATLTYEELLNKANKVKTIVLVRSLLSRYWKHKRPVWSARTKQLYKSYTDKINDHMGNVKIVELSKKDVLSFRSQFESAGSANSHVNFLKSAFNWAVEEDLLQTNPLQSIKPRPIDSEGRIAWAAKDVARFRAVHPEGSWERLAFEILFAVGCRISDLILLTRDNIGKHVQYDTIEYVSVKTNTPSFICIPDRLKRLLHRVYRDGGPVLLNPHSHKAFTSTSSFSYHFKKARDAAGVTKTPHGLRKTASNAYAEGNANGTALKVMFGWRSMRTVEKYIKEASNRKTGLEESARQISKAEHALRISGAMYA